MARNPKKKSTLKRILLASAALILFAAGWFAFSVWSAAKDMTGKEPPASIDTTVPAGAFNVLLIGTDGTDTLTDTLIMLRVDLDAHSINIISLMRDTRVKLGNHYGKLNAVYGRDGLDGLISCIKEMTGAPIHYYAMVDLEGFKATVDLLGGVDFEVPQDMKYSDPYQDLYIDLKAGMQHLDGEHAMELVRFRKYAEGDVQRTRVQKDFIKALLEQKLQSSNILKLPDLFKTLSQYVDTNATLSDAIGKSASLAKLAKDDTIEIFEFPGVGAYVGQVSYFLHDEDETYALFTEHFGGAGAPQVIKYTDYSSAPAMNPGGKPISVGAEPEKPPEETPEENPSETPEENPGENPEENPGENPEEDPGESPEEDPENPEEDPGETPEEPVEPEEPVLPQDPTVLPEEDNN
ncbi:MAG TPA: LCP family protein [Candidatus Acidoferrum sp.]|nr:LCP family protein [Candidatus Acidoferrum sp.]